MVKGTVYGHSVVERVLSHTWGEDPEEFLYGYKEDLEDRLVVIKLVGYYDFNAELLVELKNELNASRCHLTSDRTTIASLGRTIGVIKITFSEVCFDQGPS